MIDTTLIDSLSQLSRIRILSSERAGYIEDLSNIIAYVGQLQSIYVPEEVLPVYLVDSVVRADESYQSNPESIREQFPDRQGDHLKVPAVL